MTPIYNYRCDVCAIEVQEMKTMDRRNELPICPECEEEMKRVINATKLLWKCANSFDNCH